jgi:hypothetical protein
MLLVIGTQTTVVRTAVMDFSIEFQWYFRLLVEIPNLAVIFHIVGYHHLRVAVGFTVFEHPNFIVLKDNLSIYGV